MAAAVFHLPTAKTRKFIIGFFNSTSPPTIPDTLSLPMWVDSSESADFNWVFQRMSIPSGNWTRHSLMVVRERPCNLPPG